MSPIRQFRSLLGHCSPSARPPHLVFVVHTAREREARASLRMQFFCNRPIYISLSHLLSNERLPCHWFSPNRWQLVSRLCENSYTPAVATLDGGGGAECCCGRSDSQTGRVCYLRSITGVVAELHNYFQWRILAMLLLFGGVRWHGRRQVAAAVAVDIGLMTLVLLIVWH